MTAFDLGMIRIRAVGALPDSSSRVSELFISPGEETRAMAARGMKKWESHVKTAGIELL